jgi:glucosamine-6-phosphate deaminase
MKVDQLEIKIFETRQQMGESAAKDVDDKIREIQDTKQFVNIIFASAPSQNEFLAALKEETGIQWEKINAFHMDEYIGIAADAPQNFGYFLKVRLFDHVPVRSVSYLDGNATDPQEECLHYAKLLRENPIDIVCLGIGENGHLAFNDPHVAFFNDPLEVKVVELDDACRQQQVNDECFDTFGEVPTTALTLTIPTLMKAKNAFCIVPGEKKAQAIYHTVEEDIQEAFPSTILRTHPNAVLFIDKAGSGKLKEISSYSQA